MDALKTCSDVLMANERLKRPRIPKMPEGRTILNNFLGKDFKVIRKKKFVDEHQRVIAINLEVKCPFCKMKFYGLTRGDLSEDDVFPFTCPNCRFPESVLKFLKSLPREVDRKYKYKNKRMAAESPIQKAC